MRVFADYTRAHPEGPDKRGNRTGARNSPEVALWEVTSRVDVFIWICGWLITARRVAEFFPRETIPLAR